MPLYFAYGSNMDEMAMAQRCPRSNVIGTAVLHRHRIVIMAEGYASVIRDPRANVYGLLWDVALADVRALDNYESTGTGLYSKVIQPVKRLGGDAVRPAQQALVYIGRSDGGGTPLPGYLEGVIACCETLEFPAAYLAELARLKTGGGRGISAAGKRLARPTKNAPVRGERDAAGKIIVRKRFASPMDRGR